MKDIKNLKVFRDTNTYVNKQQKENEIKLNAFFTENKEKWSKLKQTFDGEVKKLNFLFLDKEGIRDDCLSFRNYLPDGSSQEFLIRREICRELGAEEELELLQQTRIMMLAHISKRFSATKIEKKDIIFSVSQEMAKKLLFNIKGMTEIPATPDECIRFVKINRNKVSRNSNFTYYVAEDLQHMLFGGRILSFFVNEKHKIFLHYFEKFVKNAIAYYDDNDILKEMGFSCDGIEDICSLDYEVTPEHSKCRICLNKLAKYFRKKYQLPDNFIPVIEYDLHSLTGRLYSKKLIIEKKKGIEIQLNEISAYVNTNKEFDFSSFLMAEDKNVMGFEEFYKKMAVFSKNILSAEDFDGTSKGDRSRNKKLFKKVLGECFVKNAITDYIGVKNKIRVIQACLDEMKPYYIFSEYDIYMNMMKTYLFIKVFTDVPEKVRECCGRFVFDQADKKSNIQEITCVYKDAVSDDFFADKFDEGGTDYGNE